MYTIKCMSFILLSFVLSINVKLLSGSNGVISSIGESYIAVKNPIGLIWRDAEAFCQTVYGTSLARISNAEENQLVYDIATDTFGDDHDWTAWIGLNDINNENVYEWVTNYDFYKNTITGIPVENDDYTNWMPGKPNNRYTEWVDNADCVEMKSNGEWTDKPCFYQNATSNFICNSKGIYCVIYCVCIYCVIYYAVFFLFFFLVDIFLVDIFLVDIFLVGWFSWLIFCLQLYNNCCLFFFFLFLFYILLGLCLCVTVCPCVDIVENNICI